MAKPTKAQNKLAEQARRKARRSRSPEELAAIRAVRRWRKRPQRAGGRAGGGGGSSFMDMWGDLLEPMSSGDISAQAAQMAQSDLMPALAQIGGAMGQAQSQAQAQQALIQSLTRNLGGITAGIGPGIANVYNQAAQTQGLMSQGFSGDLRSTVAAQAAQDAAFLQNIVGAPASQVAGAAPTGDAGNVLHGLGGLLPATALGQQGAAFGAYGATLPATVARMGQQDAAGVSAAFANIMSDLAGQQAALSGQLPGMIAKYRSELEGQNLDRYQLARSAFEADRNFKLQLLAAEQAMRQLGMDEKEIQQRINEFQATFDYNKQRDEVADAQWAIERADALAAARAGTRQDRQKARKDRKKAMAALQESKLDLAESVFAEARELRIEVTRPKKGMTGVVIGEETVYIRPGYKRALEEMRIKFSKEIRSLRRKGVRVSVINKLLRGALLRAGYAPPPKRGPRVYGPTLT